MRDENFDIDSMADDALIEVDTRQEVNAPRTYPGEPAVRLATAQRAVRKHRVDPAVWATYDKNFYQDFCGENTSESEFEILHSIAALIRCQPHYSMPMYGYDRKTAEGVALDVKSNTKIRVPIATLRADVDARIAELGVAPHLIWEWMGETRTTVEDVGFYRLPFEERIARFK
jgi:hypothetical protein